MTDANVVLGRLAPEFLLAGDLELGDRGGADGARRARGHARAVARPRRPGHRRRRELQHGAGAAPGLHRPRLRPARLDPRRLRRRRPAARLRARARAADARRCWCRSTPAPSRPSARCWPTRASTTPRRAGCACRASTSRPWREVFGALEQRAADDFRAEGFAEAPQLVRSIDMRYVGQNWELNVPMPGGELTADDFAAATGAVRGASTSASTATRSRARSSRC